MNKKQALKLIGQRTKLVESLSSRLESSVKTAERALFNMVLDDFVDNLDTKDGVISNTLRNRRLLSSLDNIFQNFGQQYGVAIASGIVQGVEQIFSFNTRYFSAFEGKTKLIPIDNQVKESVRAWLGIDEDGAVRQNGYISSLIEDTTVRNQVRDFMMRKIVSGSGLSETRAEFKTAMVGNPDELGAMQKYYRNFVYDTYSQVDRTAAKITADKLNLGYAVYEGGLIETSRKFCKERNGKVFTREEIAEFDPPTAKQPGYNPFTDLGGYGCRHHLNWIPYTLAIVFRPDLKK